VLISVARVSLSFGERLMPEHGHDLVGAAPGFGKTPAAAFLNP